MNPAYVVQVGTWWIVWTSTMSMSAMAPSFPVCLGCFQDQALANSLCAEFNDPANHVAEAPRPQ